MVKEMMNGEGSNRIPKMLCFLTKTSNNHKLGRSGDREMQQSKLICSNINILEANWRKSVTVENN